MLSRTLQLISTVITSTAKPSRPVSTVATVGRVRKHGAGWNSAGVQGGNRQGATGSCLYFV